MTGRKGQVLSEGVANGKKCKIRDLPVLMFWNPSRVWRVNSLVSRMGESERITHGNDATCADSTSKSVYGAFCVAPCEVFRICTVLVYGCRWPVASARPVGRESRRLPPLPRLPRLPSLSVVSQSHFSALSQRLHTPTYVS